MKFNIVTIFPNELMRSLNYGVIGNAINDNKIKSFKFGITHPKGIVKKLTIVIAAEKFNAISQTGSVVDNCLIAIAT